MKNIKKEKRTFLTSSNCKVYYDMVEHYDFSVNEPTIVYKNNDKVSIITKSSETLHTNILWHYVLHTERCVTKLHKRLGLLIKYNDKYFYKEELRNEKIYNILN